LYLQIFDPLFSKEWRFFLFACLVEQNSPLAETITSLTETNYSSFKLSGLVCVKRIVATISE